MPGDASEVLRVDWPETAVTHGASLLHQQCWLWGLDLRSPHGNLLLRAGLIRLDAPPGGDGPRAHRTRYGGPAGDVPGRYVVLWSGGYCYGGPEGAFCFPRMRFGPLLLPTTRSVEDVPSFTSPPAATGDAPEGHPALALGLDALAWLARYEAWAEDTAGPGYRRDCEAEWERIEAEAARLAALEGVAYDRVPAVPAGTLGAAWDALRASVRHTRPRTSG